MRVIAHMLCRNDADIIEETVREVLRWTDALIVLDGASTDGTLELLHDLADEYRAAGATFIVESRPDKHNRFADHYRNELLALTRPHVAPGDWVISVDTDEIYDSYYDPNGNAPSATANEISPVTAIQAADNAGANVVRCWVPQFWLTFQDLRDGALQEDERRSVQGRRRWYSWGWMGTFIWRWNPDHYYPQDTPKRTPELPGRSWRDWQVAGPLMPICKHYCIRSLAQGLKRAQERMARGGSRYFGKYLSRWVVDEQLARLHRLRDDGVWNTERNHDSLHNYMNGDLG